MAQAKVCVGPQQNSKRKKWRIKKGWSLVKESEDFGVIGEAIEKISIERLRSMGIG